MSFSPFTRTTCVCCPLRSFFNFWKLSVFHAAFFGKMNEFLRFLDFNKLFLTMDVPFFASEMSEAPFLFFAVFLDS
jgi:hypothetical protein